MLLSRYVCALSTARKKLIDREKNFYYKKKQQLMSICIHKDRKSFLFDFQGLYPLLPGIYTILPL